MGLREGRSGYRRQRILTGRFRLRLLHSLIGPRRSRLSEGWYTPLSIYKGVTNDMSIARNEIFGPVLSIISFKDEDEAIAIANDTEYGLGAGIWTKDLSRAHRVIGKLKAGVVMVNEYSNTDAELPFGGFKKSGPGREKGVEALHHYTQVKTVRIKL